MEKGREAEVQKVFDKWDLENAVIGEVTDDKLLSFYIGGQLEAQIAAEELVLGGGAPQYDREYRTPAYMAEIEKFDINSVPVPGDLRKVAEQLIQSPNIANKRWIYNQYDSMVGTVNASTNEPTDAPVAVVKETNRGLALTVDCNSSYVFADPYKGTMMAVSEAARNIVCSGGQPLGVTNCLNFGNPYNPEVYYQFVQAIKGMGEACRRFDTPVTGGNVSFYNQNPDGPVFPTPTIGMVGLIEDLSKKMTLDFKKAGDRIFLLGKMQNDMGSSEYLRLLHGVAYSPAPAFELNDEVALQSLVSRLINEGAISSAHDCSEGGLFVTLCESGFNRDLGFDVKLPLAENLRRDALLFGEAQSRVVVSVKAENTDDFLALVKNSGVAITELGAVTEGEMVIDGENWGAIGEWKSLYDTAIEKHLSRELESEGALTMI